MSTDRPDAAAREEAITLRDRNVVVRAGAGAGKTSLLVERIVDLVIRDDWLVSEVAAVTFTEAAAAELRERLAATFIGVRELRDASAEEGSVEHRVMQRALRGGLATATVEARAQRALDQLVRTTVTTIHGLCYRMLLRHPFEAGIAPQARIDEGEEELQVRRLWPEVLGRLSESRPEEVGQLLGRLTPGDLEDLFVALVAPGLPLDAWRDRGLAAPAGLPAMLRHAAELAERASRACGGEPAVRDLLEALGRARSWIAQPSGPPPQPPAARRGRKSAAARELGTEIKRLLEAVAETDEGPFRQALDLLVEEAKRVRGELDREGWLSFDAMLRRARDLLRDHPGVRRQEAARYRQLLVDEFQDTDPMQYEILFMLAEAPSGSPASDPWSVRLSPGRLFVVGDPKQSIFRFRGADIAACDRALGHLRSEGARDLELIANFRSPREILAPLDRLFRGWLGPQSEPERVLVAAPEYSPVQSARFAPDPRFGPDPRVEVWSVEGLKAEARRSREAGWIAARIVKGMKEGLAAGDHAILLRSFGDVAVYARALAERNVGFVLDGGRTFFERREVVELLALLRGVTEPNDEVAILGILRSSVGAVPDAEITAWVRSVGSLASADEPSSEEHPNLARVFELIRRLRETVSRVPADEGLERILGESRLREIHAIAFDGAQRVANLDRLALLGSELVWRRGLSLEELAVELGRQAEEGSDEGEPPLGQEGEAVPILTIHRAKGREFPVVFVADLARSASRVTRWRSELRMERHREGWVLMGEAAESRLRTVGRASADLLERVYEPAEERRLLYVASTRARERLVLVTDRGSRSDWNLALQAWGVAEVTEREVRVDGGEVRVRRLDSDAPSDSLPPPEAEGLVAAAERHRDLTRSLKARVPFGAPSMLYRNVDGDAELFPGSWEERSLAMAVGTAVHEALEATDFDRLESCPRGEELTELCRSIAARRRLDAEAIRDRAGGILDRFVAGPIAQRLAEATVLAREVPLVASADAGGSSALRGVADVVFEEAGRIVVADYKSDPVEDDEQLERLVQRYRPQVSWYAAALSRALRRPVGAELFFVAGDRMIAVDEL